MFVKYLINFEDSILRNDIFPNIPSNYLFSLRKNILAFLKIICLVLKWLGIIVNGVMKPLG